MKNNDGTFYTYVTNKEVEKGEAVYTGNCRCVIR